MELSKLEFRLGILEPTTDPFHGVADIEKGTVMLQGYSVQMFTNIFAALAEIEALESWHQPLIGAKELKETLSFGLEEILKK